MSLGGRGEGWTNRINASMAEPQSPVTPGSGTLGRFASVTPLAVFCMLDPFLGVGLPCPEQKHRYMFPNSDRIGLLIFVSKFKNHREGLTG